MTLPTAPVWTAEKVLEQFENLCTRFRVDVAVARHLVASEGLESLKDFAHIVTTEAELTAIVAKVPDLERKQLQVSRLRQAWAAVKQLETTVEMRKKRGWDENDLDVVLPESELTDLKQLFHARYKVKLETERGLPRVQLGKLHHAVGRGAISNAFQYAPHAWAIVPLTPPQILRKPRPRLRGIGGGGAPPRGRYGSEWLCGGFGLGRPGSAPP